MMTEIAKVFLCIVLVFVVVKIVVVICYALSIIAPYLKPDKEDSIILIVLSVLFVVTFMIAWKVLF